MKLSRLWPLPFVNPAAYDYHIARPDPSILNAGLPWTKLPAPLIALLARPKAGTPTAITLQYKFPASTEPRVDSGSPDLGAFVYTPKP